MHYRPTKKKQQFLKLCLYPLYLHPTPSPSPSPFPLPLSLAVPHSISFPFLSFIPAKRFIHLHVLMSCWVSVTGLQRSLTVFFFQGRCEARIVLAASVHLRIACPSWFPANFLRPRKKNSKSEEKKSKSDRELLMDIEAQKKI